MEICSKTGHSRITAYLHVLLLFASRSWFASEPAAPMFNRMAIQVKVIVAFWSWRCNRFDCRPPSSQNIQPGLFGHSSKLVLAKESGQRNMLSRLNYSTIHGPTPFRRTSDLLLE
jgi:hypothetical protein